MIESNNKQDLSTHRKLKSNLHLKSLSNNYLYVLPATKKKKLQPAN